MALQFWARRDSGQAILDTDLRDLHLIAGTGGTFLCAGTGGNGGISVYALNPDGAALTGSAYFSALPGGIDGTRIEMVTVEGAPLLLAGTGGGGLIGYGFGGAGGLGAQAVTALPGISAWTAWQDGGAAALIFATDAGSGRPAAYQLTGDGLVQIAAATGPGLQGAVQLTVAATAAGPVLIAASGDTGPGRITSYRLTAEGGLEPVSQAGAAEGLGLAAPTALETVSAHGSTWVILGAAGSGTLSVLEVAPDGTLMPADHLLDTLSTRFGGAQALSVAEAGGQVLIFAAGADDGIAVFSLLPDGRLVHRHSLADAAGLGLSDVTALQAVAEGDRIRVFAAGEGLTGLGEFIWPLAGQGVVIDQPGGALTGTAGGDLLFVRGAGAAQLDGGGGDDILVIGAGGATVTGGAGDDIFVLRPAGGDVVITDFGAGADRLDLSHLPMLRDPLQLLVTARADGLELEFAGTRMVIRSAAGTPLELDDLWPALRFDTPDRLFHDPGQPAPPPAPDPQVLTGTAGGDALTGGEGHDTLRGGDGADTLTGAGGNDLIEGGTGFDELWGGDGADTLLGGWGDDMAGGGTGSDEIDTGPGNDLVWAGSGDDTVTGGDGDDELWGISGDDLIAGGSGNDTLGGAGGTDTVLGGAGADILNGGAGDDSLDGGDGNDEIWAGGGDDSVTGGTGNDAIGTVAGDDSIDAGDGDDTVWSGGGDDTVTGGAGDDEIWAIGGNDQVLGGDGDDTLGGGAGDDDVDGGHGGDLIYGGGGDDTLSGRAGDDAIWAMGDHDRVWGGDGADTLGGGAGDDGLNGGDGDDEIIGGDGADTLNGQDGDDWLRGGAGADQFDFAAGHGSDRIVDFTPGEDRIRMSGGGLDFAGLTIAADAGGTRIDSALGTILLDDLAPAQIDAADFLFL